MATRRRIRNVNFELAILVLHQKFKVNLEPTVVATLPSYPNILRDGFTICEKRSIVAAPLHLELKNKSNSKCYCCPYSHVWCIRKGGPRPLGLCPSINCVEWA